MIGILKQIIVFKEHEYIKPKNDEVVYLLDKLIEVCRNKYFHTFEYILVYDIKFTNISNNEEVNFTITHWSLEFETEFYGLRKKIKLLDKMVF